MDAKWEETVVATVSKEDPHPYTEMESIPESEMVVLTLSMVHLHRVLVLDIEQKTCLTLNQTNLVITNHVKLDN